MKKLIILLLTACFIVLMLVGCTPNDKSKMSSSVLDISSHISDYDEEKVAQEFGKQKDIKLAYNGNSDYYILIEENASEDTIWLANDFSKILNRMIGTSDQFQVSKKLMHGKKYISLGDTSVAIQKNINKSQIVYDGFVIKSDDLGNIYIVTNKEKDLANGVYTFLEDYLECMFVRDDFDYVPYLPTIYLDKIDIVNNPDFEWRKMFQYEVSSNNWYKKLKNNGASGEGVEINEGWGTWCHDVFTFVDPKIYAESNPEYFVFVDGEPRQLCLSNPDIYPIIEKRMEELMNEKPNVKYWDFSINDNWDYCKCDKCSEILESTGSMMGTMLPIINKLAKRFPDKIISTLAYTYNKDVPKGIVCEKNVNIVIAPIVTGQLYSYKYGASDKAREAKELVEKWGEVCNSILIWDYVVDFEELLMPYPNFDVQKDNHDFYLENNVKAIFHQGSREHTNELACLRSYVLSRQMWDNTVDIDAIIAKYLNVTYGNGAKFVAEYLDLSNSELKEKARDLDLYDKVYHHSNDYLSNKNVDKYIELINSAIDSEKDNQIIVDRLLEIKINVLYAKMNVSGINVIEKNNAFNEFKTLVEKFDIQKHTEIGDINDYINKEYPFYHAMHIFAIVVIALSPFILAGIIILCVYIYKTITKYLKQKQYKNM